VPFHIALVGKEVLLESPSEDPRDMYTLFWELELGGMKAVTFIDVDGEATFPLEVTDPHDIHNVAVLVAAGLLKAAVPAEVELQTLPAVVEQRD